MEEYELTVTPYKQAALTLICEYDNFQKEKTFILFKDWPYPGARMICVATFLSWIQQRSFEKPRYDERMDSRFEE